MGPKPRREASENKRRKKENHGTGARADSEHFEPGAGQLWFAIAARHFVIATLACCISARGAQF